VNGARCRLCLPAAKQLPSSSDAIEREEEGGQMAAERDEEGGLLEVEREEKGGSWRWRERKKGRDARIWRT
jgi:hypothetical protein